MCFPNKPKRPSKKIGTYITHTIVLYMWSMSDWKTVCITFLLILNAAVTSPDSGVHACKVFLSKEFSKVEHFWNSWHRYHLGSK